MRGTAYNGADGEKCDCQEEHCLATKDISKSCDRWLEDCRGQQVGRCDPEGLGGVCV